MKYLLITFSIFIFTVSIDTINVVVNFNFN